MSYGGVLYSDPAGVRVNDPGLNGQILQSAGTTIFWVTSSSVVWGVDETTSITLDGSNGYIATNNSSITATLPASPTIGQVIEITVAGAGTVTIAQNALQSIRFGSLTTTTGTGGSLASNSQGDSLKMVCTVGGSSASWQVTTSIGNWTIV